MSMLQVLILFIPIAALGNIASAQDPDSQRAVRTLSDFSLQSWQGIISAVEIIHCPVVNDIYVYTEPSFKGNRI